MGRGAIFGPRSDTFFKENYPYLSYRLMMVLHNINDWYDNKLARFKPPPFESEQVCGVV
jgi:hypothetical protein